MEIEPMVELLVPAALVLVVDQVSKGIVRQRLAEEQCLTMGPLLRIRRVANRRAGLALARYRLAWPLLWALAVLGVALLLWYGPFFRSPAARMGLGAALGGATSNLLGKLRFGSVLDFIDVGFWPVFNLADVAIVLGVVLALLFVGLELAGG